MIHIAFALLLLAGCAARPVCETDLWGSGAVTGRCTDGRKLEVVCEGDCQFTAPCELSSLRIETDGEPVIRIPEDYPDGMPRTFCILRPQP